MSLRVLELHGTDPGRWGEQHGESFKDDIKAIADIRMALTLGRTDLGTRDNVLALARHHLPVLERFDRALYDELCGIARGAGVSPEAIVVANHYTDLRDLTKRDLDRLEGRDPGGCTALFVHEGEHRIVAQTWDMHGSAEPFALLIRVPALPDGEGPTKTTAAGVPKLGCTFVFSIAGCLGMTGMSSWGTALTVNNLNSLDATVGVVWPAMVRKALRQPSARAMKRVIEEAPIGSGRHYILADEGDVFGIETSGTKKKLIRDGGRQPYFHTNHCLDADMAGTCRILPGSTTKQRYATMEALIAKGAPATRDAVFDALHEVGLKQNPHNPHDVATCGALVMDLTAKDAKACIGIPGPDADALVVEVR